MARGARKGLPKAGALSGIHRLQVDLPLRKVKAVTGDAHGGKVHRIHGEHGGKLGRKRGHHKHDKE